MDDNCNVLVNPYFTSHYRYFRPPVYVSDNGYVLAKPFESSFSVTLRIISIKHKFTYLCAKRCSHNSKFVENFKPSNASTMICAIILDRNINFWGKSEKKKHKLNDVLKVFNPCLIAALFYKVSFNKFVG